MTTAVQTNNHSCHHFQLFICVYSPAIVCQSRYSVSNRKSGIVQIQTKQKPLMFGIVGRHHKIQVHFRNNKYSELGQLMPKMHQFQTEIFLPFFKTVVEVNFVVVAYFRD